MPMHSFAISLASNIARNDALILSGRNPFDPEEGKKFIFYMGGLFDRTKRLGVL
mgnify:CR=1 FL=1